MREWKYDYLRVISTIAVILLHVESRFKAEYFTQSNAAILEPFVHAACVFAVPCFFMLSGAFAIEGHKNSYWKKSFIPFLLFAGFYAVYNAAYYLRNGMTIVDTIEKIAIDCFTGHAYYHLWYMYVLSVLMLFVPLFRKIKRKLNDRQYFRLILALFVLGCAIGLLYRSDFEYGLNTMKYAGYFMLGDYIRTIAKPKFKKYQVAAGVILSTIGIAICGFMRLTEIKGDFSIFRGMSVYSSVSLVVIFISISLFISFAGADMFRKNEVIDTLSKKTYFMYLWHPFVIEILSIFLRNTAIFKYNYSAVLFILLLVTSMFSFVLSWCTASIFNRIKNN